MNSWNKNKRYVFDMDWWSGTYTTLMINALNGGSAATFRKNGQQAAATLLRLGLVTLEPLAEGSPNFRVYLTEKGREQAEALRNKEYRI